MKTAPDTDPTGDEQQAVIMLWIVAGMLILVVAGIIWRILEKFLP